MTPWEYFCSCCFPYGFIGNLVTAALKRCFFLMADPHSQENKDLQSEAMSGQDELPPRGSPDGSSEQLADPTDKIAVTASGSDSVVDQSSQHGTGDGFTEDQNAELNTEHDTDGGGTTLGASSSSRSAAGTMSGLSLLPWGAHKERPLLPPTLSMDSDLKPGEFVMRTLFADFTEQAERKIEAVMAEPRERPLNKLLQRGEDLQFDQLLSALGSVAEHCLPSILRTLFSWFERQKVEASIFLEHKPRADSKGKGETLERSEAEVVQEKRDLAVEFIFCLVLIEVLKQLPFHPGHEDLVGYIENMAFRHFKYREGLQNGPNAANVHIIADLYAEVMGVLAQSRFSSVRKRFIAEMGHLTAKEPSPLTTQSIISLLMGMKFFRVKMVPIEEFEASFQFMQECAHYFLEVKDKDVKHSMAGLFVEILVPVAANVKNEVNVPCLKNFVELLYAQTLDLCTKNKHRLALFPLVTCLLCVSQKVFFLHNWHYFLAMCLSHLKNRDPKMCRVALESLYRLLWVYMIRIKCESNSATQSRLHSIVNSLFPKGSKAVVPRDTPLNIFVKIIQFIAQERLDFAMREIVFDLLSVGRPIKIILTPERMSIGLRAFLVVADSLQQKEGEPPMPRTVAMLPSGNTLRVKKTFLSKMLTEDTAKSIGMSSYYVYVRKVFDDILRALDLQYGRPLMMTCVQNVNKEPDEMITGERKPRIDLFRTCVAAVPRLIPDGMSRAELVDLIARLSVHMDEELRALACQSLQNLVLDFPDWREDVVYGFVQFLSKEVLDTFPQLVDNGLRMLLQLLTCWKNTLLANPPSVPMQRAKEADMHRIGKDLGGIGRSFHERSELSVAVVHLAESFALVMLCNCRLAPRRLAVHVLKEARLLLKVLGKGDQPVIDVIDKCCPQVVERCLHLLPSSERLAIQSTPVVDLQWLSERNSSVWTAGLHDESAVKSSSLQSLTGADPWGMCLFSFFERERILTHCPSAVTLAWTIVYTRLSSLFTVVDPTPVNENRASLLRSATAVRKPLSERDIYLHLWKNYIMLAFRVVPRIHNPVLRCASPDLSLGSSPESAVSDKSDLKSLGSLVSPTLLYKLVVPLLRCEAEDMRSAVVHALGKVNHEALRDLMEELVPYIREAIDRKQENVRRRRRRDSLRLQLAKVFELIAELGTFAVSSSIGDSDSASVPTPMLDFVEGARQFLELETDKESAAIREIKQHFCSFLRKLVKSFPLEKRQSLLKRENRRILFYLLATWSGRYGQPFGFGFAPGEQRRSMSGAYGGREEPLGELEWSALQAMSAVLCCGPCFDPQVLAEEACLYSWLDMLIASRDEKISQMAQETVVLLLEFNPDLSALLDWVVDRCYTGTKEVADGCFLALATIFAAREYPCDHYTAIINVTLLNTGCPREPVHETAFELLQVLDKRFFGAVSPLLAEGDAGATQRGRSTLDMLLSSRYSRSQMFLSRQLAHLHPELTMPMFSEITHRLQTARRPVRQLLLRYLLPWLGNMELVDPNLPPAHPLIASQSCGQESASSKSGGTREGWGSVEATEMVLNNLFYVTVKFGDEQTKELEALWATLATCWPNNLRVILRYLLIISGMAPTELLTHAKRVVLYLGRARPERLLDEITAELQTVETLSWLIERTETPPFFRITSLRKASTHSDGGGGGNAGGGPATNGAANSNITGFGNGVPNGGYPLGYGGSQQQMLQQPQQNRPPELSVEKGTIHTKRHSGDDIKPDGLVSKSATPAPLRASSNPGALGCCTGVSAASGPEKGRTASGPAALPDADLFLQVATEATIVQDDSYGVLGAPLAAPPAAFANDSDQLDPPQPHPLPMPEYGGYFAPLTEFLPDSSQPISGFHRCNLAVMLLTEMVVEGVGEGNLPLDWSVPLPLMLHVAFLGLDHARPLVHEHCKRLLLHLLLVLAAHGDHLNIARTLLNHKVRRVGFGLCLPRLPVLHHNFVEPDNEFDSYLNASVTFHESTTTTSGGNVATGPQSPAKDSVAAPGSPPATPSLTTPAIVTPDDGVEGEAPPQPGPNMTVQDVIKSLVDFVTSKDNQPLWNYEDITAKVWSIRSADQLGIFLQHILHVFRASVPHAHLEERWALMALQLGLSCSSRHYAGRSLQVFRSLRVPVTARMLSDVLSRLIETVAEHGEDMQGYVTELILTLEASVETLEADFRPLDCTRDIFKSTPNLNHRDSTSRRGPGPQLGSGGALSGASGGGHVSPGLGHARSTSYSVSFCARRIATGSPAPEAKGETRARSRTDTDGPPPLGTKSGASTSVPPSCSTPLARSRSAQSLKLADSSSQEDKMALLAQLFWIAVSLLESDYEHEFLLALRLLERVMHRLPLDRPDCRDKVEKLQSQLKWNAFPGVHALLLKGFTNPATFEPTVRILCLLTPLLDAPPIDPSQGGAFPLHVTALLPYMVLHYEDATEICIRSAEYIAQVSTEKSKRLENLATVMTLYSRRTFSKESFQWTKCVVKYLHDAYADVGMSMLAFLVEVLERGPPYMQLPILTTIHCMLHYVDLASTTAVPLNGDLLRVVGKYVEGPHWKEALKILKLVVTRSSALVVPPTPLHGTPLDSSSLTSHVSFPEGESGLKKELPGRTMEFTFDVSQTPLIGRRFLVQSRAEDAAHGSADGGMDGSLPKQMGGGGQCSSPRRSMSLSLVDTSLAGWKRPWMSQGRVREYLVNLLTTCGQRVGLPKSPSVIFSQSSELLERQSSMASSTEEVSATNNDLSAASRLEDTAPSDQQFGVFKDFDFLEYELESVEGESADNFNWGVRRHHLSHLDGEAGSVQEAESLTETTSTYGIPSKQPSTVEESSDDGSVSPLEEAPSHEATAASLSLSEVASVGPMLFPPLLPALGIGDRTRRSSEAQSDTSCESSEADLGEVTPCNASPSPHFATLSFRPLASEELEERWRQQLHGVLAEPTCVALLELVHMITRILQDLQIRAVSLTQEAGLFLSSAEESFQKDVASQLLTLATHLQTKITLPHVFFSADVPCGSPTINELRFVLLEIREHLDTYGDRRESVLECLDTGIRPAMKLQAMGDSLGDLCDLRSNEEVAVDVGRALYRLHFQLMLLLEAYSKLIRTLHTFATVQQVHNASEEVSLLQEQLLACGQEETSESDPGRTTPTGGPTPAQSEMESGLVELLSARKYRQAINYFRKHRSLWPKEVFNGSNVDEEEIIGILNVYCRSLTEEHGNLLVVSFPNQDELSSTCSQQMAACLQLLEQLHTLERTSREVRKTEC